MKDKLIAILKDKPFLTAALALLTATLAYFNLELPEYGKTALEWAFTVGLPLLAGYLLPNNKQLELAKEVEELKK